jgi:CheY-like chemotaxis protein
MKKKLVLVVDDKEENIYLLRTMLQGYGYEAEAALNGAEALELARQNQPDLIISDILMPVMDGFALCREWKKDENLKSIPFIFYTATYTDERDRRFALGLGAERFIIKPEEPEVFISIIREILQEAENLSVAQTAPAASEQSPLPAEAAEKEESVYLKQYNEVLIRKLEAKMEQLEQANIRLEKEIAARKQSEGKTLKFNEELEKLVAVRTAELKDAVRRLEDLNRVFVGRELKMTELKKRINELENK